jgi:hypothetical protein
VALDQKLTNRFLIFRADVIHDSFRLRGGRIALSPVGRSYGGLASI